MTAEIRLAHDGAAAILTIANAARLNALTGDMLRALPATLDALAADAGVRAVILTGEGEKSFCAGADIAEWGAMAPFDFARDWIALGHRVFDRLATFPKPVIAAIDGYCFGGGLELAGTADVRVASGRASFGLPETSIGVNPGWSGVQRLRRTIPDALIREMALTGARLAPSRLLTVGFLNAVVDGDPLPAAAEIARRVAGLAPKAVEVTKAVLNASAGEGRALALDQLAGTLLAKTADKEEGITAFRQKRKAEFGGE